MTDAAGSTGPFERGHVVWHPGGFRESGRPWLVLSDDRHPFHGEEYLVAGVTTTGRDAAVPYTGADWTVGGFPRTSYVSPWFLATLKHASIERGVGAVTDNVIAAAVAEAARYLGVETLFGTTLP